MLRFATGKKLLLGVVHLAPLPGSPRFSGSLEDVLRAAREDAQALAAAGADGVIVENFGDAPFFAQRVPAETVAAMTLAVVAARDVAGALPVGVNVLRNDARAALGIAAATGAAFLRVNVHSGAAVTDQGLLEGRAAETLRERARLCPEVSILADVHVKHGAPLANVPLAAAAADTFRRALADVLIVTGTATGAGTEPADLSAVRAAVPEAPLLVGSGVTEQSAPALLELADGAIVGTWLRRDGDLRRPVDAERVARLRRVFDRA